MRHPSVRYHYFAHNRLGMKHVVFGTAGHIDHGKSALVEALTGVDPDRWAEEKKRGITIDLGFAHLDVDSDLRIALIDVPGHERFVRNMLAGAAGIDAVLLVIAANESIKPQTREHFEICRLLGISRGMVVITKSDLVDAAALETVRGDIAAFAAGSFLEAAPVIPVSARTGDGLETLKKEMARLAVELTAKPANRPFRLPVDRAFVMKGFGAVVTGTLVEGAIRKEAEAEVFPLRRRVRVRGIQVHNRPVAEAVAGERTALNLAGVDAKELHRGMMLAPPDQFRATDRMDAAISLLASAQPLKNRARVHFHCWASETLAEVVLSDAKEIRPGERVYAQLRLQDPGLYLPGDRFIIRRLSPAVTIGGGVVLDNFPPRRDANEPRGREFFQALERGDGAARLELLVRESGEAAVSEMAARLGWTSAEVEHAARQLPEKLTILGQPPAQLLHAEARNALAGMLLDTLVRFHAANPLGGGIAKEELRGRLRLAAVAPSALAFGATLRSLEAERKIAVHGDAISLAGRTVQLSAAEAGAKDKIERAFAGAGLRTPAADQVLASLAVDRARAGKILQILLKEKTLVKVSEDLIFHHKALNELRQALAARKAQNARLSVPDFKALTGVSRKYAIPLLEYLDRERVTRRSGDERVIL